MLIMHRTLTTHDAFHSDDRLTEKEMGGRRGWESNRKMERDPPLVPETHFIPVGLQLNQ